MGLGIGGGRGGVWREDLSLFEEPFDAVFLLAWGEVEGGCEGVSITSSLTMKTASVHAAEGAVTMSQRRGFRARRCRGVMVCG